eukprot:scaffold18613_cov112-Isochrysis_galbana.AAC.2
MISIISACVCAAGAAGGGAVRACGRSRRQDEVPALQAVPGGARTGIDVGIGLEDIVILRNAWRSDALASMQPWKLARTPWPLAGQPSAMLAARSRASEGLNWDAFGTAIRPIGIGAGRAGQSRATATRRGRAHLGVAREWVLRGFIYVRADEVRAVLAPDIGTSSAPRPPFPVPLQAKLPAGAGAVSARKRPAAPGETVAACSAAATAQRQKKWNCELNWSIYNLLYSYSPGGRRIRIRIE